MEPGPLERYQIGLRVARRAMRSIGRRAIDGREAHDFAMDRVFSPQWGKRRIWFDVVDAYRRERGRSGPSRRHLGRKFQPLPLHLATRDAPPREDDWLDGWKMSPAERRMAVLIAGGFTKTQTATWLGVSQTAVWDALRRIEKRNRCHRTTNPRN